MSDKVAQFGLSALITGQGGDDLAPAFQAHQDIMQARSAAEQLDSIASQEQPAAKQAPQGANGSGAFLHSPELAGLKTIATRVLPDIGTGLVELPRAAVKGVRDAFDSMIDMGNHVSNWLDNEHPKIAYSLGGATLKDSFPYVEFHGPTEMQKIAETQGEYQPHLPNPVDNPKSVTGNIEKNVIQFIASTKVAGKQLDAVGLPSDLTGWAARGASALKGFLAQFEGFSGSQSRLSDLVQSVPALANPINDALSSKPGDNEWVGRLKNAAEGTIQAQLIDGLVSGIRYLARANQAKSAVVTALDQAETAKPEPGTEDVTTGPGKGIVALGHPEAPIVSVSTNQQASKIAAQGEGSQAYVDKAAQADQIGVQSLNEAETALPGSQSAAQGPRTTASGQPAADDWSEATRIRSKTTAQPLTVYRGGARDVGTEHFDDTVLGNKTGHPSSGLGVFFTTSPDEAAQYGSVKPANLDIRNPKVIPVDKLPSFDSTADSIAFRKTLEDQGYDGLIIKNSEVGGHNWVVAFKPDQVINPAKQVAQGVEAAPAVKTAVQPPQEPGTYINFSRIDSSDDVKQAMQGLADHFKGSIDTARRGVQTFEDTKLGANAVDAWQTLMSRRIGQPLNDVESLAARQLWAESTAKTVELQKIAATDPSPENLFAFRKMVATHAAITQEVIAARTETARALSSWRIPAGQGNDRMAQMLAGLSSETDGARPGLDATLDMVKRAGAMMDAQDWGHLGDFFQKSAYAKTRDAVLEAWTNGLLTAPTTHAKIVASNVATIALRIAETKTAQQLDQLLGTQNGVQIGEASAQVSGLVNGLKDAFRYVGKSANSIYNGQGMPALEDDPISNAIKAAQTGRYSIGEEASTNFSDSYKGAIASQALGIKGDTWLGNGVDLLGQVIRAPGKSALVEHDFFRSIGYRMELNRLAVRQAVQEVTNGKITQDAFSGRVADLIENPPPNINIGAIDGMKYQTFTDAPGKFADIIRNVREAWPLSRVILPFYKIPSRILDFTFERTPLAPLMQSFRNNMAAGGAQRSLAIAQMGLGTGVMLATADAVMSGQVTGSGPLEKGQRQALEDQGWQPYSMKVGDKWVQYNRLEPTGSSMAMAADAVETMTHSAKSINGDDPGINDLALATVLSIAQDVTSKTYLQGLASFFETIANPKTEGERTLKSTAGSIVPSGLAAIDRVTDPYQRATYSMMDAIKARLPGASETLPPMRNVWGEPVKHGSGSAAYDLFSPFSIKQSSNEPIDKEILQQGWNITTPPARTSFNGATVDLHQDPKMYSRYAELAGNGWKNPAWDLGAKDLLNQIVSGDHPLSVIYNLKSDGIDGGKEVMVRDIMNQYREGAKRQLLDEFPKLQDKVDMLREQRQALRLPVLN